MLDKYTKIVKYNPEQLKAETAYERLALWLLEFGKQEGTINGQKEVPDHEISKSA